jgi:branched-chain amino acid transport system ATP-binding protein
MMLSIRAINAAYDKVQVLYDLSLSVVAGEIHCLVGRNGAGKTTILKTIMGLLPLLSGAIHLDNKRLDALPAHAVSRCGIGYVPQGRRLFSEMTVAENLDIGLMVRQVDTDTREQVLDLFPRLLERLSQQAGTLSGGEQQMLAMARALCIQPGVLLLDEPTEGLQPSMIELIRDVICRLQAQGVAVLLVEQRIDAILSIANRVSFIEHGRAVETVQASTLQHDTDKLARYLGV